MNHVAEKYEQTIEEEDLLLKRIKTCDAYMNTILEFTYKQGEQYHLATIEDLVMALYSISSELRTALIHLQLEKVLLSGQMRSQAER